MVTKANSKAPTPAGLCPAAVTLWRHVIDNFEIERHHEELLLQACESLNRIREAKEAIATEGLFVENRFGEKKSHPAVQVESDNKRLFRSLLRELGLDVVPVDNGYTRAPALTNGAKKR